jgi:hypothetical protein
MKKQGVIARMPMRFLWMILVVSAFPLDVWAVWKNCHVEVRNPDYNNQVLVNQCFDFPDDTLESTYAMAKGLCEPEWEGMKVKVKYVPHCMKPSAGICRFTFPHPQLNFKYKIYYYSVPSVSFKDNKQSCIAGGGEWLQDH